MAFTIGTKPIVDMTNDKRQWCKITVGGEDGKKEGEITFSLLIGSIYAPRVQVRQGYARRAIDEIAERSGSGTKDFKLSNEAIDAALTSQEELLRTLAEEVVFDWKDVKAADGSELDYDAKVMADIMREWPVIRQDIERHALDIAIGIEKQEDDTVAK